MPEGNEMYLVFQLILGLASYNHHIPKASGYLSKLAIAKETCCCSPSITKGKVVNLLTIIMLSAKKI